MNVGEPVTTPPDSEARALAPGPTRRPVEARPPVDLREARHPEIRAVVESMVAQTARLDEKPSAAATAWMSQSEGDAADTASETIGRLGIDLVSTIVNCAGRRRDAADWRPAHLYSFLSTMRGLDKQRVSTLRDILLAGRRGDISSSRTRRLATRLLVDDLRNLERFQHALRKTSAPISDSGVSWFDPKSGLDLYAYASCGMAAKEWGLTPELVRDCVESKKPVNGLHFRRQYRWPLPAGAEPVARGVYRVGEDRYRVQLGEEFGFLGNFDSAGAAILVHNDARGRLREVGVSLMTRSARQLIKGQPVAMSGAYVILRRLEAGYSLPPKSFSMRSAVTLRSFSGSHDVYFVSKRPGFYKTDTHAIASRVHWRGEPRRWQDPVDANRGLRTRESLRINCDDGSDRYLVHHHELTLRSGNVWAVDESASFSLVQVFCVRSAPTPQPEPEKPAEWAQCSRCDKWRVLPENISASDVPDAWTCGDIGVSCEKIECSLEDETCACHTADETVVMVAEDGTVEATYCSPAGAGAALGVDASTITAYAEDGNARPLRVKSVVIHGTDHATVGTRVWAVFDAPGAQKWWGGTVVGSKGEAGHQRRKLDIIFDDGDRQYLPASDVRFSPPAIALPVAEPAAGARAQLAKLGLDAATQTPAAPATEATTATEATAPTATALPVESRVHKPHVQLARLLRAECLNPLFALPASRWFLRPVNTEQFPRYRDVVAKPMDLSAIGRRLDQCQYRNPVVDFLEDFSLIALNAATFNGFDHAVAQDARALAAAARAACDANGNELGALERAMRTQTAPAALERAHVRGDTFASADECRRSMPERPEDDYTYSRVFRKLAKRIDGAVGYPNFATALRPLDAGALYADPGTVSRDGVGNDFELVGGSCFLVARSRTARLKRSTTQAPNVFLETRYDGRLVVAWRVLRNVAEGETLVAAPPRRPLIASTRPPSRQRSMVARKVSTTPDAVSVPALRRKSQADPDVAPAVVPSTGSTITDKKALEARMAADGWTKEEKQRGDRVDNYWIDPKGGPKARSIIEVARRAYPSFFPEAQKRTTRDETSSKVRYRPDSADESEKEATPRVWALFEADPGIQRWWGGSVVGASGSGATRVLDVVFDDGERLSILEQRVRTEQPMPLPIAAPNAAAKKLLRKLSGRRPRKRARRSTPVATHGRSTRTRRGPAKSYAQSDSDSDDVVKRPRPPPRSPGPLPKDSTCCICLDPVLRRRDAIIFECEHFVCKSCSSDLARHTAESGAVSTRRGVSVTCPLCRRRAKLEI